MKTSEISLSPADFFFSGIIRAARFFSAPRVLLIAGVFFSGVLSCPSLARAARENTAFFTPERFSLNMEIAGNMARHGVAGSELSLFAVSFSAGLKDLASGARDRALKEFEEARKLWPEFFATDFLIALIYEEKDDYKKAARYYKSYLKKLKNLESGAYRISGPVMFSLLSGGIEEYGEAYARVKRRMQAREIDIDKVSPAGGSSGACCMFFLGVFFIFAAFFTLKYKVVPSLKVLYRVMNPPEGFWACRNCGAYNPNPAKECTECRRPRESGPEKARLPRIKT